MSTPSGRRYPSVKMDGPDGTLLKDLLIQTASALTQQTGMAKVVVTISPQTPRSWSLNGSSKILQIKTEVVPPGDN